MSTDYYLTCKDCSEAVFITDSKANHFEQFKDKIILFLMFHGYGSCNVVLENDQVIEHKNVKQFDKFYKWHTEEVDEYLKQFE